jgi:2-phosphosulfolactate phosphatase
MRINVISTAKQAESTDFSGKTVVMIDVLRASSVMTTALWMGAKAILPVLTPEDALQEYSRFEAGTALLCGEREARRIEGFHLGNSPLEFTREAVQDKIIIHTTSNGTRAANAAINADQLYVLSFLNIDAVAMHLSEQSTDLSIICSGTDEQFSMDDALCAGMLVSILSKVKPIETDDLASTLKSFAEAEPSGLRSKLSSCKHLNYLIQKGFEKDIDFCLQKNTMPIILSRNGRLIITDQRF